MMYDYETEIEYAEQEGLDIDYLTDSQDYPQYTFQHDISGVVVIIKGMPTMPLAHLHLQDIVNNSIFLFPEGSWALIGVQHYTEEW